jgi:hypothetical protein
VLFRSTTGLRHDIGIDLSSILPDRRWLDTLPQNTPPVIEGMLAGLVVTFDRVPEVMGSGPAPMVQDIDIQDLQLEWGPMQVSLTGQLEVGPTGDLGGRMTLRATGWRQMLDLAEATGALPAGQVRMLSGGLATLERDGVLEAPIELRDGTVRFAGLPVGTVPNLR